MPSAVDERSLYLQTFTMCAVAKNLIPLRATVLILIVKFNRVYEVLVHHDRIRCKSVCLSVSPSLLYGLCLRV